MGGSVGDSGEAGISARQISIGIALLTPLEPKCRRTDLKAWLAPQTD